MRLRIGPLFKPIELHDSRIFEESRAHFTQNAAPFVALGFSDEGIYIAERVEGSGSWIVRAFSHAPSSTFALLIATQAGRNMCFTNISLVTRKDAFLLTTTEASPRSYRLPHDSDWFLPSLYSPEDLWGAHQRLLDIYPSAAIPLPRNVEGWRGLLDKDKDGMIDEMVRARLCVQDPSGAFARPTVFGVMRMMRDVLWPWRQRRLQFILDREEAILEKCGLGDLLRAARSSPPARPQSGARPPDEFDNRLPDDRGKRFATATSDTFHRDDRNTDPLLRSLVAKAERARGEAILRHGSTGAEEFSRAPFLANGLCASCLYSLNANAVEPDGCIVCSECGAAWKRTRIHDFRSYGVPY